MKAANLWLELIMLIIFMISGATAMTYVVVLTDTPIISYTNEKTAQKSVDIDNIDGYTRYGRDLLASLINADESTPYPNAIKIDDSPIVKLDSAFFTKKFSIIGEIYDANGQYKLSTKLTTKVTDVRFEVIDGVDVMHYYLSTTPQT